MRLLCCGDVLGRSGREAVQTQIPLLRQSLGLDFVVVNGENAAHGLGITAKICEELFTAGVDAITPCNHAWDQKEVIPFLDADQRMLRPRNYPAGTPGRGATVLSATRGRKVLVVQVMGRLFMDPLDDPFAAAEALLKTYRLGGNVDAILFDFHGEATSEKMAFGHFVDGRASFVVGTHTHVPTADHMILEKGTAYQTDAGMCGDSDSVIGMEKTIPVQRFTRKLPTERLSPANGAGTLCGALVELDDKTGLARRIDPIRVGGKLAPTLPR